MQMIEAIVKPHKVEAIKEALASEGITGVTAIECYGFGRQFGHSERYRGARLDITFVPKVLLQVCVVTADRERAIEAIVLACRSGEVGDGKLFVHPVARAVRIRTGERDESAV